MREIRWQFWAVLGTVVAGFAALGPFYAAKAPDNLLFDIATIGTFCAAALVIIVYTILGLVGPAKWWRNDVGTVVVMGAAAMMPLSGVLAWVVIFNHGLLTAAGLVWTEIGAWYWAWAAMIGLGLLALRSRRALNRAATAAAEKSPEGRPTGRP